MIDDRTEFQPERWAWPAAVAMITAVWLYFLLFVRAALPELARVLAAGEDWRIRLVLVLAVAGGVMGSLLAGWRFRLVRFQSVLGLACRGCGAAAALALVGVSWSVTLLAATFAGLALGWVAVTLISGLRGTVGTGALGRSIGAGLGLGYALAHVPLLLEATARVQTIVAAIAILAVSVLTPFLTPQEPSLSPRPEYGKSGLIRWGVMLFALTLLIAALPALFSGAEPSRAASWPAVFVPGMAAALAGWWLDGNRRSALAVVTAVALGLLLTAWALPSAGLIALVIGTAGAGVGTLVLMYYPARGARAGHAATIFGFAGWLASGMGALLSFSAVRLPTAALIVFGVVLLSGLLRQWLEDGVT